MAKGILPIGLEIETVQSLSINFLSTPKLLVVTPSPDILIPVMKSIVGTALESNKVEVALVDDTNLSYSEFSNKYSEYATDKNNYVRVLKNVHEELEDRVEDYEDERLRNIELTPKIFMRELTTYLLILPELHVLQELMEKEAVDIMVDLLTKGPEFGVYCILGGTNTEMAKKYENLSKELKFITTGLVIGKVSEQNLLKASNLGYREPNLEPFEGYRVSNDFAQKN